MEKLVMMRSLYRSISRRSFSSISTAAAVSTAAHQSLRRGIHCSASSLISNNRSPFAMRIGSARCFSDGLTHLPDIKDGDIKNAFKELMAVNWAELPDTVVNKTKRALSRNTEDKASQEALANLLRAAEAVEEFSGFLVTLKMEIDDSVGMSGEDVKPLSDDVANALNVAFGRYYAYLESFGPDEGYLKKKVENELGMKLIHLKMRCSGLGGDWGKVTVLGTSGISGSYIEHRA
ncbi:succinate dehydrogenase subunit 5, mitochondrial-like [Rutidosis leptorrhynchoides]|uniref:succinate dehydrogenase subunit 5, mitochondrial-like n=1 Tax=Rutidosis leptorrhynchoides TaxID=125765 RepID=UPI003A98D184